MSGSFKKVNFFFKELGNGTLFLEIYIYFFFCSSNDLINVTCLRERRESLYK